MTCESEKLERNQILNNKQTVKLEHIGQWNIMQLLKEIIMRNL
jgi:hypothetical protein